MIGGAVLYTRATIYEIFEQKEAMIWAYKEKKMNFRNRVVVNRQYIVSAENDDEDQIQS